VIDITVVWAGPFASALLSDLGAEVIRVESNRRWDRIIRMDGGEAATMKAKGQIRPDAPAWEVSSNFNTVGRNRKSVTMDLTRPEGMEAFYRLVEQSDIFIENNAPDVVHHLSIDYETLKQHNPRLIMLSLSAFGATGPYRNYRAYGSNMEALVGHALLRGYADTDPTHNTSAFFADACAGATAAFAAMAAVKHRMNTGRGQYIDMSQSRMLRTP
jgi:crotonobetainyl-CoA:carnitine CoA-transferase CaiB-like acyl-CoA transferase